MSASDDLLAAIDRFAGQPQLLIALDFDGVLSPLVDEPSAARPLPEAASAVRSLAASDGVTVVLLSGRGLDDLRMVSGLEPPVHMIGSHGGEFDDGLGLGGGDLLTSSQAALRQELIDELAPVVDAVAGAKLERKPGGVAVHVRGVDASPAADLLDRVRSGPASRDGVDPTEGKDVIDLAVLETSKGSAVDALRAHLSVDAVLFAGDDVTDETAFRVLGERDVGIKVGDGDTAARYRVDSPSALGDVLARLASARR